MLNFLFSGSPRFLCNLDAANFIQRNSNEIQILLRRHIRGLLSYGNNEAGCCIVRVILVGLILLILLLLLLLLFIIIIILIYRESVKSGHHCCPCQAPPPPVLVTTSPSARMIRQSSQPEASVCCCSGCCCPLHAGNAPSAASLRQLREPGDGIAGIAADSLRINGGIRQFRQVKALLPS